MSKSFGLKASLNGSSPTVLEDIPDISNLDKNVRFSLRSCDISKFCIRKLRDQEIKRLYERFGYFEQLTWKQARQMKHEKGFSIEKKQSGNHEMLIKKFPQYSSFMHFRVNGTQKPFRVFGAILEDLCCLLLVDKDGIVNH